MLEYKNIQEKLQNDWRTNAKCKEIYNKAKKHLYQNWFFIIFHSINKSKHFSICFKFFKKVILRIYHHNNV